MRWRTSTDSLRAPIRRKTLTEARARPHISVTRIKEATLLIGKIAHDAAWNPQRAARAGISSGSPSLPHQANEIL